MRRTWRRQWRTWRPSFLICAPPPPPPPAPTTITTTTAPLHLSLAIAQEHLCVPSVLVLVACWGRTQAQACMHTSCKAAIPCHALLLLAMRTLLPADANFTRSSGFP